MTPIILFTIDVEDWFQVENFKSCIPFSAWNSCELRVEKNVHRLLDLFDDFSHQQRTNPTNPNNPSNPTNPINPTNSNNSINPTNPTNPTNPKSTFFILGWLAERLPDLVREIHARGHEVASHGYNHGLCGACSIEELKLDLKDSKKLLEDIIGAEVCGYRAPSFSINELILKVIQECGYWYDSSYNSFGLHGRYGKINLNGHAKQGLAYPFAVNSSGEAALDKIAKRSYFYELPISNLNMKNPLRYRKSNVRSGGKEKEELTLPWGGGGYFRLTPLSIFKTGVKSILKRDQGFLFYCHPWEIDPDQPQVKIASGFSKFRHYSNLKKSYGKLEKFISNFTDCEFLTCRQYLERLQ